MPTLSELRASRPIHRAERAFTICLAPHLVSEVQGLTQELESLDLAVSRDEDGERSGPPRKMGQVENPRDAEIEARLAELLAEMAEHEGELRIRALDDGEWRRWVNAHPARVKEDDPAGYARDIEVAAGYCNADDLIEDLGMWAFSWDGDPLAESDWPVLTATIARPDKKVIARAVVGMHEQMGTELPKWRAGLSATLRKWPAAVSPVPSADLPASSSDESPQSDTSTTTPTTD